MCAGNTHLISSFIRVAVWQNSIKNNEVIQNIKKEILKLPEFHNCCRNRLIEDT